MDLIKVMDSVECITTKTRGTSKFKSFGGTFEKDAMIQSK
jgi:hypothetical protein